MIASLKRILAIMQKEFSQLRRDYLTYAMIVGIPIAELLLFGYAINLNVKQLNSALVDSANTAHSRELSDALKQSQVFDFIYHLDDTSKLGELFKANKIQVAVVIPEDFEQRIATRQAPFIQMISDGAELSVQQAIEQLSFLPVLGILNGQQVMQQAPPVQAISYYNPQQISAHVIIPGLIGAILTMTLVLFTAVSLVRERERGNLEFLITTPLLPYEITLGKVLPYILIGLIQTSIILALGHFAFGLPIRGSILAIFTAAFVFILASLALGVFISTLAKTQFQAMQITIFTFLPQLLLSGFMFPFAGMPEIVRTFAELLPLTHFVRLSRGILLKQAELVQLWPELLALGLFAIILLSLASLRFKKRLD